MKSTGYCLLFLALFIAGHADGVTLKESRVHRAMTSSIQSDRVPVQSAADFELDEFGGGQSYEPERSTGRKSTFKAALYSAVIPGGGHYYLGRKKTARYFFAAEALTWIGYFSFRTYGNWKKDDYINYGATYANAQLDGKSDEFLNWVGFYENIREFNTLGRAWDPDRPYLVDTPENHWEWATPELRQGFRDLRNRSEEAFRRSDFMIGIAIIDRIIAVIDAVRTAGKVNRSIGNDEFGQHRQRTFKFSVNPFSSKRQVSLTLYTGLL